ncbi:MAG: DNA repair protein RecN [Clostridia bacterium]|nr:DNA repair protein RecN [Clostridia bacterium]
MLSELKIENVAIIERAQLSLSAGFNVLTGETGAGKSIILDAINMTLGERTSREILRSGADRAEVTALFTGCGDAVRRILEDFEIDFDGEVLIRRRITADGRNSCRVNGSPVSVSMLKTLGGALVNIHGQHDSQALFQPENHYKYIDALAENEALLDTYRASYRALRAAEKALAQLQTDESEKARELDMLRYQIDELEKADLRAGERDELQNKVALFRNSAAVLRALQQAYAALSGDDESAGATDLLGEAADALYDTTEYFDELQSVAESLESASLETREYISDIRDAIESLDMDPRELAEAEDRLDTIYRLSRKYGETEEDMLAFLENAQARVVLLESADERAASLEREIAALSAAAVRNAAALTESRLAAGEAFASRVCRELEYLDMPSVRFIVQREGAPLGDTGADKIEFLISANVGEAPRPIARIASGGELSRIMLAIKNVLSARDAVDTLIFDEIDTGVSGRAAQKVGYKLAQTAENHQVICVTHLSQIAVMADTHLLISKSVHDGQTYTAVQELDFEGRKQEIARINGGTVTPLQLQNAEEMLLQAAEIKRRN